MSNGLDEFAGADVRPEAETEETNVWDANFFGDFDTENIPDLTNGTYRMVLANAFPYDPEDGNYNGPPHMLKYTFTVVWAAMEDDPDNPNAIFNGEEVRQRFDVYPRYRREVASPKEVAEVKKAVKKLMRELLDPLGVKTFNPRKFKDDLSGLYADIEIRINYSEKTERSYANVHRITPVANDSSSSSPSGGFSY